MEAISCNICGSTFTEELFTLPDYLLDRASVYSTLVKCLQCGLIYQKPRLTQEELNASYPENYEPYKQLENVKISKIKRWIKNHGINRRVQMVISRIPSGRLLDIGCAGGTFLHSIQKLSNWELYGIEPNRSAAEAARKYRDLNIFNGTLDEVTYPDSFFDAVTLWDVLEHLPDPNNTLLELNRIIRSGGMIAIRIPNFDSLEIKIFGRYWIGLDAPRHLYVFSKMTIKELLLKTGFQSLEIKTGIGSYPSFILCIRFWLTGLKSSNFLKKNNLFYLRIPSSQNTTVSHFFLN